MSLLWEKGQRRMERCLNLAGCETLCTSRSSFKKNEDDSPEHEKIILSVTRGNACKMVLGTQPGAKYELSFS